MESSFDAKISFLIQDHINVVTVELFLSKQCGDFVASRNILVVAFKA